MFPLLEMHQLHSNIVKEVLLMYSIREILLGLSRSDIDIWYQLENKYRIMLDFT